jgi:NADH-quinone oxidoreductase subunit G
VTIHVADPDALAHEMAELGPWDGQTPAAPDVAPAAAHTTTVLATWRVLLDLGRLQDGEPNLAGTAPAPVARVSPSTAESLAVKDGDPVTVSTERGSVTLPAMLTDMPDQVVWLPQNSPGSRVYLDLGAAAGDPVSLAAGGAR